MSVDLDHLEETFSQLEARTDWPTEARDWWLGLLPQVIGELRESRARVMALSGAAGPDIAALQRLMDAAWAGPWSHSTWTIYCPSSDEDCGGEHEAETVLSPDYPGEQVVAQFDGSPCGASERAFIPGLEHFARANAEFICAARNALPDLLEEVAAGRALRAQVGHGRSIRSCACCGASVVASAHIPMVVCIGCRRWMALRDKVLAYLAAIDAPVDGLPSNTTVVSAGGAALDALREEVGRAV